MRGFCLIRPLRRQWLSRWKGYGTTLHYVRGWLLQGKGERNPSPLLELRKLTVVYLPKRGMLIRMLSFGNGAGLCGPITRLASSGNGGDTINKFYEAIDCRAWNP